jgi:hypothetical protein
MRPQNYVKKEENVSFYKLLQKTNIQNKHIRHINAKWSFNARIDNNKTEGNNNIFD